MRPAQHAEDKKSCSDCGKTFHSGIVLAIHKHGHTDQKPYKCDLYGVALLLHLAQMKHLHEHHEHQSNDGVHDDQKQVGSNVLYVTRKSTRLTSVGMPEPIQGRNCFAVPSVMRHSLNRQV